MEEIIYKFKEAFIAIASSEENYLPEQTTFSTHDINETISVCNWEITRRNFDMQKILLGKKFLSDYQTAIKLYFHADRITMLSNDGPVLCTAKELQLEDNFEETIESIKIGFELCKNSFN